MTTLSVCIEMFWRDLPFEQRIAKVAESGITAFEFWNWKNRDIPAIKAAMEETGLDIAALCLNPGHTLICRGARAELEQGMADTSTVAHELGCKTIIATVGNTIDDETYEISRRRVVGNLSAICHIAEDQGLTIVLEPLNTLVDHHGYWLQKMSQAVDLVKEVDSPAAKILMDLYHQQITEGNLVNNLRQYIDHIGHFHCAGVPGRHELLGGEQDYRALFAAIDDTGYTAYVGLEYRPLLDETVSLAQTLGLCQ